MPAQPVQQSVLHRLIPLLVLVSIAASLPAVPVRPGRNTVADINQHRTGGGKAPHHTPRYEFAYGVKDPITGDHKDRWEKRDGDRVQGVYMFEEADGTQRIVEYEADGVRGFRAIVTNVQLPKGAQAQHDTIAHSYNMLQASTKGRVLWKEQTAKDAQRVIKMSSAKVILLVGAVMLLGLSGSVAQTDAGKEAAAPKENVTEVATVTETELTTERFNASRVLSAIRAEIERRRSERREKTLQRAQERREQILQTLDSLSERRREYELRRQEMLQDAEALREARRQDMEARRVGRLPQRERERVNRARLEQLSEQTTPEENEIEDSVDGIAGGSAEVTDGAQRVRNLLLIEEADGNLRLIDLDTEEGQQYVLNGGTKRGQSGEAAEQEKEATHHNTRKMKFLMLFVSVQLLCFAYTQDIEAKEERKLISYETKVFHKIPEHTIIEEKIKELKKIPESEKKETTVEEKSSIPSYEFGYGVKDPISGDHKDQWEKRQGDHVKGAYRFDEPDGTQRVVEYEADGKKGFEATVKNVDKKEGTEEGAIGGKKEGKVAHSYSYLKRTGH
uniref:Uncharacterized protein n=1 Tax=Anopheles epiroticus TaxID=199890 RepID=A0A182PIS7_9DIPT